jgi:hypothetical protein
MRLGYRLCLAMKLATLILTMSVASLFAARAEDASIRGLQSAQAGPSKAEHQPAGACTPIGLTANGDIVFPWECRETIEKQRGPISVSLPNPLNEPPPHEQSPSPDTRKEDAVATAAAVQPKAEGTMSGPALPPEVNETAAPAKSGWAAKRASDLGRSKLGQKGQHATLRSHQSSSGPANVKKDRVALQPAAAQK